MQNDGIGQLTLYRKTLPGKGGSPSGKPQLLGLPSELHQEVAGESSAPKLVP